VERNVDGVRLHLQELGDLPAREIGPVAERDQLALAWIERADCVGDREPFDRTRRMVAGVGPFVDGGMSALLPPPVVDAAAGDPDQPREGLTA
jgi:hypothetical protein